MPYSVPSDQSPTSTTTTTTTTAPRTPHRRTRSSGNFTDERGPGAFAPLGALPRSHKRAVFHINIADDDDEPYPDDDSTAQPTPRPSTYSRTSYLSPTNSLRLSMNTGKFSPSTVPPSRIEIPPNPQASVPFPTSSPLSPSDADPFFGAPHGSTSTSTARSSPLPRTPSTPIILSNGKPLKPSLKSSSSSPNIPDSFRARAKHLRAQSAPSTPAGPKNVHFAEDAGLESVRVFNRSGKPASLSKPPGEETETETEAEMSNSLGVQNSFPFPSLSGSSEPPMYEIDPEAGRTSSVPAPNPSPYANIHLETLALPRTRPPALRGTVLVRNIAFEKRVAVRFTLDDWQTTSEVACRHVVSLPSLPPPFPHARTIGDLAGSIASGEMAAKEEEGRPSWDRFSFTIRLEDYEHKLADRTLFIVARYSPGTGGEWWDNNSGSNYRVGFRRAPSSYSSSHSTNLAGMGLGMGMGISTGLGATPAGQSQQRTFSAPSTLRVTPPTGALAKEDSNSARAVALAAAQAQAESQADKSKSRVYAPPLQRSASSPFPPASSSFSSSNGSIYGGSPSPDDRSSSLPTSPAQAFISKRLSLSNYVAPGSTGVNVSMATPPMTPPNGGRTRSASLPTGAGMNADMPAESEDGDADVQGVQDEQVYVGEVQKDGVLTASPDEEHEDEQYENHEHNATSSPEVLSSSLSRKAAATLEPLDFRLQWSGANGFGADMGSGLGIEFPAQVDERRQAQLFSPPGSPLRVQSLGLALGLDVGQGQRSEEQPNATRFGLSPSSSNSSSSSSISSNGMSSGHPVRERDANYAALIRQWCFTGTPTGSPVGSPVGNSASTPFGGHNPTPGGAMSFGGGRVSGRGFVPGTGGGYGFPGFGFGMADAGMVGAHMR